MTETEPSTNDIKLLKVSQFYVVAMFSVFAWDCIVLFKAEWYKIWMRNWGLGNWNVIKLFYILNKYGMLVEMCLSLAGWAGSWSQSECAKYVRWEPGWGVVPHTAADVILLLRTWTFTGRRKPILFFLCAFLLANTGVRIAATLKFIAVPTANTGIDACIATGPPGGRSIVLLFWILPFMFTSSVAFLTMGQSIMNRLNHRAEQPFFTQLYRDGIFFILIIFAVELFNALFFAQPNSALQTINVPLTITMVSMMSSRIVLHLWAEPTAFLPNFGHHPSTSSTTLEHKVQYPYRPSASHSRPGSASANSRQQQQYGTPLGAMPPTAVAVQTTMKSQVEELDPYFARDTIGSAKSKTMSMDTATDEDTLRNSMRKGSYGPAGSPYGSPYTSPSPPHGAPGASPPTGSPPTAAAPSSWEQAPRYNSRPSSASSGAPIPVALPQVPARYAAPSPPDYSRRDLGPPV